MRITDSIDKDKWDEFINSHPDGNIFQSSSMLRLWQHTKNWEPLFLAAVDGQEDVLGVLLAVLQEDRFPGRWTRRAVAWAGPLVRPHPEEKQILNALFKAYAGLLDKKRIVYAQFRNLYKQAPGSLEIFALNGYKYASHLNYIIHLNADEGLLWRKLYHSKRKNLKQARQNNLSVIQAGSISHAQEAYEVLRAVYKRLKAPLADKSMFLEFYRLLCASGAGRIFLVYYKTKAVGAQYLLVYKDTLYAWYGGCLSDYFKLHPNEFLLWEAIKWGCRNNFKIFDTGGAGSPKEKYGPRQFKKEFGARMVDYGRLTKAYNPWAFKLIRMFKTI